MGQGSFSKVERFQKKQKFKDWDDNDRKNRKPNRDKPKHKRWEDETNDEVQHRR